MTLTLTHRHAQSQGADAVSDRNHDLYTVMKTDSRSSRPAVIKTSLGPSAWKWTSAAKTAGSEQISDPTTPRQEAHVP